MLLTIAWQSEGGRRDEAVWSYTRILACLGLGIRFVRPQIIGSVCRGVPNEKHVLLVALLVEGKSKKIVSGKLHSKSSVLIHLSLRFYKVERRRIQNSKSVHSPTKPEHLGLLPTSNSSGYRTAAPLMD